MLIDKNGRVFDPKKLPPGRAKREAKLAELREVPEVRRKHGSMFSIGERGKLVQK